jgi:hypothetical protein
MKLAGAAGIMALAPVGGSTRDTVRLSHRAGRGVMGQAGVHG